MIGKYTYEKYEKALRNRLDTLVKLFNKEREYPFQARFLGFPVSRFNTREEIIHRIKEICEILHEPYPILIEETERYSKEIRIL